MAEFLTSYNKTAKWEGGYVNHKSDRGAITYCGISRKYHPNWTGWKIVDNHKPLKNNTKIKSTELESLVKQFYYREFWQPIQGDYIENQSIANIVYDLHVNSGKGGLKAIQRAIGVKADGVIGSKTIQALNGTTIETLQDARKDFYYAIVERDSSQSVFLDGWLNRLSDFG